MKDGGSSRFPGEGESRARHGSSEFSTKTADSRAGEFATIERVARGRAGCPRRKSRMDWQGILTIAVAAGVVLFIVFTRRGGG